MDPEFVSDPELTTIKMTRMRLTVGFGHPPDCSANITTTLAAPVTSYIDVPLSSYEAYDPCQFLVLNRAISGAIGINDTAGEEQQVWPVNDPARVSDPKERVADQGGYH